MIHGSWVLLRFTGYRHSLLLVTVLADPCLEWLTYVAPNLSTLVYKFVTILSFGA